jgi:hypothetical protein
MQHCTPAAADSGPTAALKAPALPCTCKQQQPKSTGFSQSNVVWLTVCNKSAEPVNADKLSATG